MPRARKRIAVDEHLGARVRSRRRTLGMNQSVLAARLGVTFQMIQRYEYGLCRISASTLHAMASALDVPVSWFFDGLAPASAKRIDPAPKDRSGLDLVKTSYGRALAELFPLIPHRHGQRAIVELVRAMANEASAPSDQKE